MISCSVLVYLMDCRLLPVFKGLVVLANLLIEHNAVGSRATTFSSALLVVILQLVLLQSHNCHISVSIFCGSHICLQLHHLLVVP